ncbi:hypothetical protein E5161_00025 [Cohnella pontilimi]|uniref:Uncharacterized protein n=1 Tax=Cohnella pontilimi TaxID=2564100 RepID=A0A4V5LSN6_9BACL|nr:hypothetical protein [Cohnella pontilimi]TJY43839.1 hypothetical protein E5161_00025 [Cohnella pontilimi]
MLSAVGVGVGCFYSFLFFIFNLGDGLLSNDNKPAAFGVAALAVVGTIVFLLLGRLIYNSYSYIGTSIVIIVGAAILTLPIFEAGNNVVDTYQAHRVKPYVESYMRELKTSFVKKIAPLEFDDNESKTETLRYWSNNGHDIWIKLRKKNGALTSGDLNKVINALPPAKFDVRVFIYYESFKEYPNDQYLIDFAIQSSPTDHPYCHSDDYENNLCDFIVDH